MPEKQRILFKMCTNNVEFGHFPNKNKLSLLFVNFSSDGGQKADFIFYFFPHMPRLREKEIQLDLHCSQQLK